MTGQKLIAWKCIMSSHTADLASEVVDTDVSTDASTASVDVDVTVDTDAVAVNERVPMNIPNAAHHTTELERRRARELVEYDNQIYEVQSRAIEKELNKPLTSSGVTLSLTDPYVVTSYLGQDKKQHQHNQCACSLNIKEPPR